MDKKVEFLYINEPEAIQAGVTNMPRCVEVMEEVFDLMGRGDYVEGGLNNNSHGIMISFPDQPVHPGMPHNGPDRRFMAMVAYLGGRFQVAGEKWYGSNRDNLLKGLPRSILMVMLNDKDTGAPLALISANLISAVRTGAIPGVGAKHLARKDAKVITLVGAGVIGRTCFMSLVEVCKGADTVRIYDIFPEASQKLAGFIRETYPQIKHIHFAMSMQDALANADIVNIATSGDVYPRLEEAWLKPGAFVSLPAGIDVDPEFVIQRTLKVVDNWKMYEAWKDELAYPYAKSMGLIGTYYLDWIAEGKMQARDVLSLGEVVSGQKPGRVDENQIVLFGMGGQPVYDVAWGFEIWQNARKQGLGTLLKVWDEPYLY